MYKLLPLLVLFACKQATNTTENTQVQASSENVETGIIDVNKKEMDNPKTEIENDDFDKILSGKWKISIIYSTPTS